MGQKLQSCKVRRVKSESYRTKNGKKGKFVPFHVLVVNQGGAQNPRNVAAAKNIAEFAIRNGEVRCDIRSKRLNFLDVLGTEESEHQKGWSLDREEYDAGERLTTTAVNGDEDDAQRRVRHP